MPLDHRDWFEYYNMGRYNWGHEFDKGTSDPANGLLLRLDLVELLEEHRFVFFPAGLRDGKFQFMTYMCSNSSLDPTPLLHRRLVTLQLRVSEAFLYARFGLNIIRQVHETSEHQEYNTFPVPEGIKPTSPRGEPPISVRFQVVVDSDLVSLLLSVV